MKEKKSLLEKFGLVEKVEVQDTPDIKEEDQELMAAVEKMKLVKEQQSTARTTVISQSQGENEDPTNAMKSKKLYRAEDIYKSYNIKTQGINSLFIIESFLKALPDYLPIDVKRESMLNIVMSSGVSVESLMADGNDKLRCMKEFSESFTRDTNDTVLSCENEIRKLNEKISNYKKAIDAMKKLQEEQGAIVRYETERINNILHFMNPNL
ncbi:hypothetical protein OXPF_01750 [Oxobacter pfennigii]|uniref:Uncharacterized protein n=1 Tax=Oxobacter pfennigii TaxID=36849 RepID=A0A0N8NU01_9CLOT|nr:hypothetical protein [Oxobacter pfennigii]KPU46256.1 hypothetical protein OXPF_01750 [Oxobacter pfennigii]